MKLPLLSLAIAIVLASCSGETATKKTNVTAKGDVHYGGVLKVNEVEDFRNLFPLKVTEVSSHRIANQIYEGLVKLRQEDLTVKPALAERWDINEDATVFTFYLRKGVKFHNDPAFAREEQREVTAQDFKYCFDLLCSSFSDNNGFWVFQDKVKGATEYYESTQSDTPLSGGVSGVKVLDDYTLQIELNYPFAGFLQLLSTPFTWVFPQEVYEMYWQEMRVKAVGTGPFQIKNLKEGEAVVLERNPEYWDIDEFGNPLPYLDAIKYTFIKEKKAELLEFRRGNIDVVYRLPLEMIDDVTAELEDAREGNRPFELQNTAAQSVFYLAFQTKGKIFDDKLLRQAFNYAIDRESLVRYTLQGEGIPAVNGIVPPAFKGYDIKNIEGYSFDPSKARNLLAEAGYPNGLGFPELTLQINSGGGDRNVQVAGVIQNMLKENLNIEVAIRTMPRPEHLQAAETGKADFWRTGWIADYPDPENFLNLLYGAHVPATMEESSYINPGRYVNPVFDSLFLLAHKTVDLDERYKLYQQAEQVAMDDAAILPLFYDENTRLIQMYVKNLPINAMEYRDFTRTYIDPEIREKVINKIL